jgi:hypothetical protein
MREDYLLLHLAIQTLATQILEKMYYDSEEQYKKLQELKKRVDPTDIFHTNLTVQLPDTVLK